MQQAPWIGLEQASRGHCTELQWTLPLTHSQDLHSSSGSAKTWPLSTNRSLNSQPMHSWQHPVVTGWEHVTTGHLRWWHSMFPWIQVQVLQECSSSNVVPSARSLPATLQPVHCLQQPGWNSHETDYKILELVSYYSSYQFISDSPWNGNSTILMASNC